jgi:hypothetical protein
MASKGYAVGRGHRGEIPMPPKVPGMSLGTILTILVLIYLHGGWSGRFRGCGYGLVIPEWTLVA